MLDNKSIYNKLKRNLKYHFTKVVFCQMTIRIPEYKFKLRAPEFQKDDDEFVVWFLEGVLENYPSYIECLMYLGNKYTVMGMYEKGLQIDLKLIRLRPRDPLVHYNLACSYSLLGMVDRALPALDKAIELGYKDIKHLENDADLERLRSEEAYRILLNKLKKAEKKHA